MMIQTFTKLPKTLGLVILSSLAGITEAQIFNWSPAGPIYTAGRSRNMIVDKTDNTNNTFYVGSSTSGIFKTTDGGVNWGPLNDQGTVRNISYMGQAFNGEIYAATGEGFLRPGQQLKAQPGTGLYKLVGNNLVVTASAAITGTAINRIATHPSDANKIVIATNFGVLYSSDGGVNFTVLSPGTTTANLTYGIDVKFDNNGILYFSLGQQSGLGQFANVPTKVYRSTDASLTAFTNITPTNVAITNTNYGRIELAVSPSNPNVIYAQVSKKYIDNSSANLSGLFVSDNGGSSWGLITQGSSQLNPLSNGGTIATGDYSQVITVDANNPGLLYIGGYKFMMWAKTSASYITNPIGTWIGPLGSPFAFGSPFYLHENFHDIKVVNSGGVTKFYFVTDAGIYRSTDMTSIFQSLPPSFQPFYQGLVTGQFNSVSIESFPLSSNTGTPAPGTPITPYSGFVGGTGANGFTYFSGNYPTVSKEQSYLSGEIYNSEYSKILPEAAYLTTGSGGIYKTSNANTSAPTLANVNYYTKPLSSVAPAANDFANTGYNTTGTPFKIWENYGQLPPGPDVAIFYNDSLRVQASMQGVAALTSQTNFTFSASRPSKFALIDSIVIRTGTVVIPLSTSAANSPPFTGSDRKDLLMSIAPNYAVSSTSVTVPSFTLRSVVSVTPSPPVLGLYGTGSSNNALHGATLNPTTLVDNIAVTFTAPPFATKGQTSAAVPDPAVYYRVFATIFYKYKAGDTVKVTDNSISTKTYFYSSVLTQSLSWRYGAGNSYVMSAPVNTSVPNSTFVISPSGTSSTLTPSTFTVSNWQAMTYTISQNGTYSFSATPVVHTITAVNSPTLANSFTLDPGAITQSTSVFVVTPTANTIYTITAGNGTSTAQTFSTVGASTYVINPGNISQSGTNFVVNPTSTTIYTIQGLTAGTSTLVSTNTSITYTALSVKTTSTFGYTSAVPFAPSNISIRMPMIRSARLAMAYNSQQVTGSQNAVVVAKAPLNLNDPLNLVRVSQSGCLTDDANGAPTNSTITIPGKPVLLEWSKSGTELYYATDDFKLYRVSHITNIMDLAPPSYSGKFFTDIFAYNSASPYTPNAATINPVSPYRTTLIGSFTKPITSISVSKTNDKLAVTFNDPAPTGTAGIVLYNTNSSITSNLSNIGWVKKDGTGLSNVITYCSLMEKNDNKKVFIGTDNGMFYTNDITAASPSWSNVNNNQLPNVQIFDIEQQVLSNSESYNSGQIYVATNGRGVWTNNAYLDNYIVSVREIEQIKTENNLSLYPNPTNGLLNVSFKGLVGESVIVHMFDLNGRLVKSEDLGKINSTEVTHMIETGDLNQGIYIVKVNSDSGVKRVAKLIVTK